jgi:hypothetical protein
LKTLKRNVSGVILFFFLLTSCSKEYYAISSGLTDFQEETIVYFKEIALGVEFGNSSDITRRWKSNMKIYVGGELKPVLMIELKNIIHEINTLSGNGFSVSLTDSLSSNFYIFLGSGADYGRLFPSSQLQISNNLGLFNINWDANSNIYKGRMYVDIFKTTEKEQRHLLREELTQALGLAKDSNRYTDSIFQQDWTVVTKYSNIDKELIRLLYHPLLKSGLNATQVEKLLVEILMAENL